MIEFVLAAPFLAFLITAVLDVGNVVNEYMVMTEAVHQGVRLASTGSHLRELGDFKGLAEGANACPVNIRHRPPASPVGPAEKEQHRQIQERVKTILDMNNTYLKSGSICIISHLEESNGNRNVKVTVTANYKSFFPILRNLPISVEATAPFLH
jgi:hypothetical protein